jgi:hypothetical protein
MVGRVRLEGIVKDNRVMYKMKSSGCSMSIEGEDVGRVIKVKGWGGGDVCRGASREL